MLVFLPLCLTRLNTSVIDKSHWLDTRIQEFSFTHGQSPWNSALRVIRAVDSKYIVDYLLLLECGFEFDLEGYTIFVLANPIAAIN